MSSSFCNVRKKQISYNVHVKNKLKEMKIDGSKIIFSLGVASAMVFMGIVLFFAMR